MANEITVSLRLGYKKDGTDETMSVTDLKFDVTGKRFIHNRSSVGATEEALDIGDISTGGWFFGINHDPTNFVEIRDATGTGNLVKCKPGEPCCFRMSDDASAPFVIADTAACDFEYLLIED